jgi:adenylate cyclase, class 2
MSSGGVETEVKFYLRRLEAVRRRLLHLDARPLAPRRHEVNLRFDSAANDLGRDGRLLRLRRCGEQVTLTYKGRSENEAGALVRPELEVALGDFEAGRRLLEALGYRVTAVYEKYRSVYAWQGLEVSLDELPYGDFLEIEGPSVAALQAAAARLALDWSAAVPASYLALFERLCAGRDLDPAALTFAALADLQPGPEALSVRPADG